MIEEIIQKHKEAAEQARTVVDESLALEEKIQEGLKRLDYEISRAHKALQIVDGNIVGQYCEWLVFGKDESKDKISEWEAEIESGKRFLERTTSIREELERQASERAEQIRGAKAVEEQLIKLCSYRDQKDRLREDFSDGDLIELGNLVREINAFEPELFEKDFLPFFAELKGRYHSESRVLNIPVPDADVEKFWRIFRYEFLRHDLLSRPWKDDDSRDYHLVGEMRTIARVAERYGPLAKDFTDVFLPQLQTQNLRYKILELR